MVDQTYTIPNRFGLRAILLVTAIFAIVFAVTKAVHAELRVVAPVLGFVLLVCFAQILFGKIPRLASAVVGGVVFPAAAYMNPLFDGLIQVQHLSPVDLFWFTVCGLLAGYLGGVLLAGVFLVADHLQLNDRRRVYCVPRRFSTGTMLLAITLFAIFFAFLNWANARPWQLFFYTSFVVTVGLAQMILPRTPRWASVLAGGVFLPLSVIMFGRMRRWMMPLGDIESIEPIMALVIISVIGLVVGYLGGAMIAGVFLVSDYVVKYFWQGRAVVDRQAVSNDEPLTDGTLSHLAQRAAASRRNVMEGRAHNS